MTRRLAAWVLIAVLAAPGALGQGVAVEGSDTARVRPAAVAGFPPYANAGYRLSHGENGELMVEVSLEPLESAAPFPSAAAGAGESGKAPARPPAKPEAPGKADTPGKPAAPGKAAPPPTKPAGAAKTQAASPADAAAGEKASAADGEVARLARRLTADARTQHAAVSALLGWMARTVADSTAFGGNAGIEPGSATGKAENGPSPAPAGKPAASAAGAGGEPAPTADPQAPEAVLERKSGDPVGVARLAVALLSAAGLEARVVRGVVAGTPEPGGAHGRHAWIEVRYPDRGWVFSDPLRHHHYVPATYLRAAPKPVEATASETSTKAAPKPAAAGAAAAAPPAVEGEARVLERRDRRKTVDLYPPGAPGVTARRNRPEQLAAALRVVVAGGGRALAVLEGPDGRVSKVLPTGEGVFVGLAGGRYRLEVFPDGGPPVVRQMEIQARERGAVFVRQDSATRPAPPRAGSAGRGGRRTAPAS